MVRRLIMFTLLVFLPFAAAAQDQAALVADRITVIDGNLLRAEGNVEVLFEGLRLRATSITYDRSGGTMSIEGPMSLSDTNGETFFLADAGQLSRDFRNGILKSARLVLSRRLQIAGAELRRVDGRYTELSKAVATTCPICDESDVPLWQIRADRIVHDQLEKRIYFQNAVFDVAGVPVFYVPKLRMPDSTVDRATGFLVPDLSSSSALGAGIKIPYFIALGDHADLTVTPYFSPNTTTLGLRYRQLFKRGAINLEGAVSSDDLSENEIRGYLFGNGVFFLPRDFELGFNLEQASDDSYLSDYDISGQDRTRSDLSVTRTQTQTYFKTEAISFQSFRDEEEAATIPAQVGGLEYRHRFEAPLIGGQSEISFQAFGLARTSDVDVEGRDYSRISAGLGWQNDAIVGPGMILSATARVDLDHYAIGQDSTADGGTNITSVGALQFGMPLVKHGQDGATHVLEPKIQIVASNAISSDVPNEESTMIEFDEGSLWAMDRIPGSTEYELGTRINAGATWTRYDPNGWSTGVTFGRVFRDIDGAQFNEATGLSGIRSDWLVAAQLDLGQPFSAAGRILFDDSFSIRRSDMRISWQQNDYQIDANFLWHVAEPEVGRDLDTWELHTDASFPMGQRWEGSASMRYDFVTGRAASAGLNFTYKSQCITAEIGVNRRFTSSEAVTPRTDFTLGLSVPPVAVASKRPTLKCSR